MDSATELEHIEKLAKEAECLKIRLEDERQKLNDITRNCQNFTREYYIFLNPIVALVLFIII